MVSIFEMFIEVFICSTADGLELFVLFLTGGGFISNFKKNPKILTIIFGYIFIII